MSLQETLTRILSEYPAARMAPLEGHPLAQYIRGETEDAIVDALGSEADGLIVQGSPGQGNWAAVPWISIFDPAITTSATRGYYVVYVFHATKAVVHLSLNQGTTVIREEFGAKARDVLNDRAEFMRKRVSEFQKTLPAVSIDLGSDARLPGDYVAGHAMGITYTLDTLPNDGTLQTDLRNIVRSYRALTFRGGIEGDTEPQSDLSDEFNLPAQHLLLRRGSMSTIERLNEIGPPQRTQRSFTALPVRRAISILSNGMGRLAKASSRLII
jgi:5-methylcytosine-specific restriction protein A